MLDELRDGVGFGSRHDGEGPLRGLHAVLALAKVEVVHLKPEEVWVIEELILVHGKLWAGLVLVVGRPRVLVPCGGLLIAEELVTRVLVRGMPVEALREFPHVEGAVAVSVKYVKEAHALGEGKVETEGAEAHHHVLSQNLP